MQYNLARDLEVEGIQRPRQRFLSAEEIQAFWSVCEDIRAECATSKVYALQKQHKARGVALLQMRLLLAQREREVRYMRRDRLVERNGETWYVIPAELAKNRQSHGGWMPPRALALVAELGTGNHVFPSLTSSKRPRSKEQRVIEEIRVRLGQPYWHGHDLRRTAATHLDRLGVARTDIRLLLNHSERDSTVPYIVGEPCHPRKRETMKRWDHFLSGVIGEAQGLRASPG